MSHLLSLIVAAPAVAAAVLLALPAASRTAIRVVSLLGAAISLGGTIAVASIWDRTQGGMQLGETYPLLPSMGISIKLAADGWSVVLLLLTGIIIVTGVLASWTVAKRDKDFFVLLLVLVSGVFGVFVSQDLFVFFLFYEIAVLPMYLLIGIWGASHQVPPHGPFAFVWKRFAIGGKEYAAMKLTVMLLIGSAAILVAMCALWVEAGERTFDLQVLEHTHFAHATQLWVFPLVWLGFGTLAGVFPFHTWSPDGHASAPTAVSMLHAGVLMKLGAFGVMRIGMVILPEGAVVWAPVVGSVAVVNVLYGALCAASQTDLKYIVAYSSVSHMGVVMLGAATLGLNGWNGAVYQMFAHGIMTGLFFALVGLVYERAHTRAIAKMGGFAHVMPAVAAFFTLACLSSLGLPGTAGFVAEFLVFLGAAQGTSAWWAIPGVLGAFVTAIYVLRACKTIFWGPAPEGEFAHLGDARRTEWAAPIALGTALVVFGFWPRGLLDFIDVASTGYLHRVPMMAEALLPMTSWLQVLSLDLAVLGVAVGVLLLDVGLGIKGRTLGWLTAAGLLAVLGASFAVDITGKLPHDTYVSGAWVLYFKRVFLMAAALSVLGSIDWLDRRATRRQSEYYLLLLLSVVGMMLIPGARDWVLLVIAFELMGVPLYILSAWAKDEGPEKLSAEAGLKLFVTGAASSGFTLFGLALVTGLTGTTHIGPMPTGPLVPLSALGMAFVLAGFAFKIGAVPFHFWVPDTYQGAPTPFVAFLSVAPKLGGVAALSVVLLSGWSARWEAWVPALIFFSAASMVVGNFFALPQTDLRRLLGFSGIAQIGYALMALCAHSEYGLGMALFFMATYVFTNLGVFFVVHAAAESSSGYSIRKVAGLSRRSPWLGAALLIFLLSLAGIPFVAGFWGKLFVFLAAYRAGLLGLVFAGVALAVVGLFYYLQVARSTFMADGDSSESISAALPLKATILACLIAVVGLGLWPQTLLGPAMGAAGNFFGN